MSLVNDMLRDLERRRAGPAQPLQGLNAVSIATVTRGSRRGLAALGIAIGTLATAVAVVAGPRLVLSERAAMLPTAVVDAARSTTGVPTGSPEAARSANEPEAVNRDGERLRPLASAHGAPFRLSYAISTLPRAAARRVVAKPEAPPGSRKRATASLRDSRQIEVGQAAAIAPVAASVAQPEPAGQAVRLSKVAIDPAQQLRREGLTALRAGRHAAAADAFRKLIVIDPGRNEAHLLLYQSLQALDRHDQAHAALVDALTASDEPERIAVVLAHRLMAADDAVGARRVLEQFRPADAGDVDYEALLAAAYERSGDNLRARDQYALLTAAQPQRGAWWVGLGIACEGLGLADEAVAAFERARRTVLEPALANYAVERLRSLEEQL